MLQPFVPRRAWWDEKDEVIETKAIESGEQFMPAFTQIKQAAQTLSRLAAMSSTPMERSKVNSIINSLTSVMDDLSELMQEYT
jgi:hypothetical protein